jgi:chromosome partitioning protein
MSTEGPEPRRRRGLFGSRRRTEPDQQDAGSDTDAPPDRSHLGEVAEAGPADDETRSISEVEPFEQSDASPEPPAQADAAAVAQQADESPLADSGIVETSDGGHVRLVTADPRDDEQITATPAGPPSAVAEASPPPAAESPAVDEAATGPGPGDAATAAEGTETVDEPVPLDLPAILAIANQKGGVGKTTTAVNLGASLAELGHRVLVIDLDPQGNATTGLGINPRNLETSIYDVVMNDVPVEDCVEPTSLKNLFVVPATIDLAGAEIELVPAFSRELKLRRALEDVRDDYDFVLIDCPPSLGLLTVNGLAAADAVVVPIQCEYYALEGLGQLLRNVALVRNNLNPTLDVRGIVLTMYDARTKLADQVEQEVRGHFGPKVYRSVVPRTVRLSEAPSFGQPIIVFDPTSRGAIAYRELAKEVSRGAARRVG